MGSASSIELGLFLRARRVQVNPQDAGITVGPGMRRTPGLRREELAARAGVSVDYYTRLERGREHRPSPAVVDALAAALDLDDAEHDHLIGLAARAASLTPPRRSALDQKPSSGTEMLLERLRPYPARLLSRTMDLLACNPGGIRTLPGIEDWPAERHNIARYLFLHPAGRDLFPDHDAVVSGCVARLRALAGTEPDAPDLTALVEELLASSKDFARLWERYDVRPYTRTTKTMNHPAVGTFTLSFQVMQIDGTPGHCLVTYYAEPGTPDHDAIVRLDRAGLDR
ncbi:transcriptional regulator with XRE-family HTH domain [Actinoplanes lutulentus]|uniref:Helix-turn-helix protein n=1 Tax=Actinoplanes lutulentus TaxID=1287878 RepID=A0A327Z1X4_9ACTN|nr:helix-turn-helix transcriptional regulator [Actinoplanes lutulentus]MBB2946313.1 transcriptional regulator with XRE-family HTH domain [Actinoplanes lutulentus]RAK28748.1 helix-turn-helix protein [Actinoplanes lutulentus]